MKMVISRSQPTTSMVCSFQCTWIICSYILNLLPVAENVNHLHAAVFEIPYSTIYREFDVIVSFSSGVTKGLKDSATGKVKPHNTAPPIDIPVLSLDELIEKTDDFGSTALIGEGSYGRVYYAILDNGTKMAVKKLDSTENEPTTEFLTQVGVVIDY